MENKTKAYMIEGVVVLAKKSLGGKFYEIYFSDGNKRIARLASSLRMVVRTEVFDNLKKTLLVGVTREMANGNSPRS